MANDDDRWTNREWDSTLLLLGLLALFVLVLIGLFVADMMLLNKGEPRLLTEALVHTILGFIGGWLSSAVTFFFGVRMSRQQNNNGGKTDGNH